MMLEVRDLCFSYRGNRKSGKNKEISGNKVNGCGESTYAGRASQVLSGINFCVHDGEMISLLGKNGAGKTTLLRLIAGFLVCSSGSISFDGVLLRDIKLRQRASYMAYIPQISRSVFSYPVKTSILMGASNKLSIFQAPGPDDMKRVDKIIELLNLEKLADRNMDNISGGERQLVLIARALMQDARLLILDEPTSFLDYSNQLLVLERIGDLVKNGYSCIYSTHNPDLALRKSSRVMVMDQGLLCYDGVPDGLVGSDVLSQVYGRNISIIRANRGIVCIPE